MSSMSTMTVTLDPLRNAASVPASPGAVGPTPAGSGNYGSTEERILSATLQLVGRRGMKRLGMQEVSEAAGVSRGTLYRYFPSKECLLDAVADFDERVFNQGLAAAVPAACRNLPSGCGRSWLSRSTTSVCVLHGRSSSTNLGSSSDTCWYTCRSWKWRSSPNSVTPSTPCRRGHWCPQPGATGRCRRASLFASSFIIPEPDDRARCNPSTAFCCPRGMPEESRPDP